MPPLTSTPLLLDELDTYDVSSDIFNSATLVGTPSRSLSAPSDLEYPDDVVKLEVDLIDSKAVGSNTPGEDQGNRSEGLWTESASTRTNIEVKLPVSTLTQPRSLYDGFDSPATESTEPKALDALVKLLKSRDVIADDFLEFNLHNFSIYVDSTIYPNELRPLQSLNKSERFFFDGILSLDNVRFYLKRVPFRQLPVGNYGADDDTVRGQIWIRSFLNERLKKEIYYKLGAPSPEYARFHGPFLWVADLAKHVIDYCDYLRSTDHRAILYDFKSRFSIWALQTHKGSKLFQKWHNTHGSNDFRGAIISNLPYIWRETCGVDPASTKYHRFWKEIHTLDQYQPNIGTAEEILDEDANGMAPKNAKTKTKTQSFGIPKTTATPYIYDLFSHMSFGKVLESITPSSGVEKRRTAVIEGAALRSTPSKPQVSVKRHTSHGISFLASIKCGDVISTPPDDAGRTDTKWTLEASIHHKDEHVWYGLVQKVHQTPRGKRYFDVIWLYHPRDTPCAKMKYPWKKELFLSDNCTCHSDMAKVKEEDVISTHAVHWFGDPSTSSQFFVRQTYITDEQRWITLQTEHLACDNKDVPQPQDHYRVGDTILVQMNSPSLRLKNFMIETFFNRDMKEFVRLRELPRRRQVDTASPNSPPNELVYSERMVEIEPRKIARRCLVRVFRPDESITAPYDRNGVGDAFFITHQELTLEDGKFRYAPASFDSLSLLRQGFNPDRTCPSERLQGLDLFCGGGNFGRGLEDGDAIEMRWTNDIWKEAIHTYMANTKPGLCTPFLGSVDDLLRQALLGNGKVPRPGEVQFISGGSPCPGFSLLTNDKTTDKQRKNQSLVASFASYIDLYRPHYGLLENVIQMVQTKHNRDECVFSQLVSAIVGLGYQTQILFMDAWAFGAPQSRSRVFLLFTAPGLRVPKIPVPTHSHPPKMPLRRLGLMSNGQSFSRRENLPTPFKFVSAMEAVSDLPDIQDSKADYSVGFPDHRLSIGYSPAIRKQLTAIPTQPWEMNFSKAYYGTRVMDESTRQLLFPPGDKTRAKPNSHGWGRIHPNDLFPTITTSCGATDARIGGINHWYEPRPITILEARRAQGFLDHEVLIGSPMSQYKIVGNSVARQVALALGLAIREAWFGTLLDEEPIPQRAMATTASSNLTTTDTKTVSATTTTITSIEMMAEPNMYGSRPNVPIVLDSCSSTVTEDFTPRGTPLATPATSDLSDLVPTAPATTIMPLNRKRSSTLYVEIATKKHKPATNGYATVSSAPDESLL